MGWSWAGLCGPSTLEIRISSQSSGDKFAVELILKKILQYIPKDA